MNRLLILFDVDINNTGTGIINRNISLLFSIFFEYIFKVAKLRTDKFGYTVIELVLFGYCRSSFFQLCL